MKVILLENVPKVGNRYEVATVADGFALNYLIPQKKAEFASPAAIARIQKMEAQIAAEREASAQKLETALAEIDGKTIAFALPANDEGTLFAALGVAELLEALNGQFGTDYSLDQTDFAPIKEVGETAFTITVGDTKATVNVAVSKDSDEEEE